MTALFVLTSALVLITCIRHQAKVVGRLALLAPSTVLVAGIFGRFGVGSLIMRLTPREWVLSGEYSQYLVAWQNIEKTSGIWLAYTGFGALTYAGIQYLWGDRTIRMLAKGNGWMKEYTKKRTICISRDLEVIVKGLLALILIESLVGMITGSTDRGSEYEYWASKAFTPVSGFIAFSRLRQLAFLLVPAMLIHCKKAATRIFILSTVSGSLLVSVVAGGRGTVLYPLVMIWLGWIVVGANRRAVLGVTLCLIISLGIAVPSIAAYRDSSVIRTTSSSDLVGRLKGMINKVDVQQYKYRIQALGREIYACSDSFLFLERNRDLSGVGFSDISVGEVGRLLLPKIVSGESKLEKNDGSAIAKQSMGVVNPTWFPCISTAGDLWRRNGYMSVCFGGVAMGILVAIFDLAWVWVGCKINGILSILLVLYPASYVHYGLLGTTRELIWQIGWELPKYILVLVVVSSLTRIKRGLESS